MMRLDVGNGHVIRDYKHQARSRDRFCHRVLEHLGDRELHPLPRLDDLDHDISSIMHAHDLVCRPCGIQPSNLPDQLARVIGCICWLCFLEPGILHCALLDPPTHGPSTYSASAPEMISISSLVMLAWRWRL